MTTQTFQVYYTELVGHYAEVRVWADDVPADKVNDVRRACVDAGHGGVGVSRAGRKHVPVKPSQEGSTARRRAGR